MPDGSNSTFKEENGSFKCENNRNKMRKSGSDFIVTIPKISTGDFDAVIIGHSQLIKVGVSPEREQEFIKPVSYTHLDVDKRQPLIHLQRPAPILWYGLT